MAVIMVPESEHLPISTRRLWADIYQKRIDPLEFGLAQRLSQTHLL